MTYKTPLKFIYTTINKYDYNTYSFILINADTSKLVYRARIFMQL